MVDADRLAVMGGSHSDHPAVGSIFGMDRKSFDVVTNMFRVWRCGHLEGRLRPVWHAVGEDYVEIPGAFGPAGDRPIDAEMAPGGLRTALVGGTA